MKFSVLIPSIPNRIDTMRILFNKLQKQIDAIGADAEVLAFLDNKKRSVGYKRDALVQIAAGEYLAFVDDDDDVYDLYIPEIMEAIKRGADVIVFNEHVTIDGGNIFTVHFGMEHRNEECRKDSSGKWVDVTRKPFHSCVWKSEIAKSERFADASYGEDWHWCKRLIPKVKKQYRIDKVLSKYTYNSKITEAAHVFPRD